MKNPVLPGQPMHLTSSPQQPSITHKPPLTPKALGALRRQHRVRESFVEHDLQLMESRHLVTAVVAVESLDQVIHQTKSESLVGPISHSSRPNYRRFQRQPSSGESAELIAGGLNHPVVGSSLRADDFQT